MSSSAVISRWEPENQAFWQQSGEQIAKRNLWISIPCLLLAFSVSIMWSIVVLKMPLIGFQYSKDQLFLLTALPMLSGATLRIFYSFMPSILGGRKWTTISTASLLIPAIWLGMAVQDATTPFSVMLVIALLTGLGSGNFASSMANIAYFFPKSQKGYANGMNAGLGNLGVSVAQFVMPLVITGGMFAAFGGDAQTYTKDGVEHQIWLQNAAFIWVPFIIASSVAAWFGMNDLSSAKASFSEQAVIFRRKDNWLMCWLYLGTFGSFIGFSSGFALLSKTQFPNIDVTSFVFIGPLIGALVRPMGGWVSDKIGGARVTAGIFAGMIVAVIAVLSFLPDAGSAGNFWGFFISFQFLFVLAGIGNGSTYRMIPTIFLTTAQREAKQRGISATEAEHNGTRESAAAGGFISAIGAYGGFLIPQLFGFSMKTTGAAETALYVLMVFYVSCLLLTLWRYARKSSAMPC
ncbi:NNP family nitrate/nitrite transporter-like MFS transporter [Silvimonas terrae]|uniref:Nitrate/nitrite transporter n=1 Tax=Silvimonas terrae TaxID=300266 RepID=A0A840RJ98_9NEIS|nr:NarK family nitrate/nitrite MFS transporter [Silvimonas terrae]MBB5192560.1 NNP family nitrate/nitrite transporter-like MFS transporter [Silvimonas terrae]